MKIEMRQQAMLPRSKSKLILVATLFGVVLGCPNTEGLHAQTRNKIEEFDGWIRFIGEFELYGSQDAMRNDTHEGCISGTFPLSEEMKIARHFNGEHVKVYGRRMHWDLAAPKSPAETLIPYAITYNDAPVKNWCFGDSIIFAVRIKPYN